MSERGAEFFGKWVTDNVMRGSVGADIISVAELTTKLFADAKAAGVSEDEIEEEVGSAYEAIRAAIVGSGLRLLALKRWANPIDGLKSKAVSK